MAGKTAYWTFENAAERDTYGSPEVQGGDFAVTTNDGALWVYDAGLSSWVAAGSAAPLDAVLNAGNMTGGNDVVFDAGDAIYTEAAIGAYPTKAKAIRRVFSFQHVPSGSPGSIVDFGPVLYLPDFSASGLEKWGGWVRLVGSVAWEDGTDTQREFFAHEGPVSEAGAPTPVLLQGLMRSTFPGGTDYGAMQLQAPGANLQLRGRDWNDAFTRRYVLTLELHITDGRTQA